MSESTCGKTSPKLQALTGQRFGRLTVVRYSASDTHGSAMWECRCECSSLKVVYASNLKRGITRSCGCLRISHGHTVRRKQSKTYRAWRAMQERCYNTSLPAYRHYGGRGIAVCSRWRDAFGSFLADMGDPPTLKHELDRKDNDKGYWCGKPECSECGPRGREANCRWVTHRAQMNNTRASHVIEFRGRLRTVHEWAELVGINPRTLTARLKRLNWSVERALTESPRGQQLYHGVA